MKVAKANLAHLELAEELALRPEPQESWRRFHLDGLAEVLVKEQAAELRPEGARHLVEVHH